MKQFINKRFLVIISLMTCMSLSAFALKVTFNLKNVTVMHAMTQLKKKTGYSFVFCANSVDVNKLVNVNGKNAELSQVIDQILDGQDVAYNIDGKRIIISPKETFEQSRKASDATQQIGKTIKGKMWY